ncbi:MAG: hypothetical protein RR216_04000, partial [Pseudoflavonifractor sp.]
CRFQGLPIKFAVAVAFLPGNRYTYVKKPLIQSHRTSWRRFFVWISPKNLLANLHSVIESEAP